ncbi:MAG: tetratricopeptide repeat protein [Eubacterium sp.]|nr:tetratricopeptide repeat protein [Eubacterium sp.]
MKKKKQEIIEDNRIGNDVKSVKDKQRQARKSRNIKLAVMCAIFSIIVIIGTAYIVVHSISDKEKLREQGIAAFKSGNYNEAISLLQESFDREQWFSEKMDADTEMYLAACYMRTGEFSKAYDIYFKYSTKSENKTSVSTDKIEEYLKLANALDQMHSGAIYDSTISSLENELENGNSSANLFLGICYQYQGETDKMLKAFNQYADVYGMNSYVAYQLSSYYIDKGDYENARAMINRGLQTNDMLYIDKLMFNDIVISEAAYDYEEALEKAERLIKEYPENETYRKEYDFLYSRINMDPEPVNDGSDEE